MLQAQMKNPSKGDWVSTVKELLKKYQIKLDMTEIKNTKPSIFKNLVKNNIAQSAFDDLIKKQLAGKKRKIFSF